ncbi:uncharacterized protein PG998_008655 [Apiospora kogelbergensis]|uniref:uncharacterized protein n=1 Tax=Apiospora kogelbergensis TaxID=1337665 RepID=UPI00313124B5
MGKSEPSIHAPKSDSGYGDDPVIATAPQDEPFTHPLARKGYEIGPASNLNIGDVFEFLWADTHEFEWEWKCLGYNRFIVLRHSDTFPHHCVCIPISNGGKIEFAKPGIDTHQQGYVYAEGDVPNEGDRHRLPYSPISIELKPGKLRVKEESRVNYADILEIDHDSQVMVVGDVARYFDRVRRNVNKATMRKVLPPESSSSAANAPPPPTPPPGENHHHHASEYANYNPSQSQLSLNLRGGARLPRSSSPTASIRSRAERAGPERRGERDQERRHQRQREQRREKDRGQRDKDRGRDRDRERERESSSAREDEVSTTYRLSHAEQERRKEFPKQQQQPLPRSSGRRMSYSQAAAAGADMNAVPSSIAVLRQGAQKNSNYDIRSMHDVALAGYHHQQDQND